MIRFFLLALCIIGISNSANALTAGQLEEDCKQVDAILDDTQTTQMARGLRCLGYIEGFVNAIVVNGGKKFICIPEPGISVDRVRKIFLEHMEMIARLREFDKKFPGEGVGSGTYLTNEEAWLSFQPALMKAFPCSSE